MSANNHEDVIKAEAERKDKLNKSLSLLASINEYNNILRTSRQEMTHLEKNKLKTFLKDSGYTRDHLDETSKQSLSQEEVDLYNKTINERMTPMPKGYSALGLSFESKETDKRVKTATNWILEGLDGNTPEAARRNPSDESISKLKDALNDVKEQIIKVHDRLEYYNNPDQTKPHLKGAIDFAKLEAVLETEGVAGLDKELQKNSYLVDAMSIEPQKDGSLITNEVTATYISGAYGNYGSLETPHIKGKGAGVFVPLNDVPVISAHQVIVNVGNLENKVVDDNNPEQATKVKNNTSPQEAIANTLFLSKKSFDPNNKTAIALIDSQAIEAFEGVLSRKENRPNYLIAVKSDNRQVFQKDEKGQDVKVDSPLQASLRHLILPLTKSAIDGGKNSIVALPDDFNYIEFANKISEVAGSMEAAKDIKEAARSGMLAQGMKDANEFSDLVLGIKDNELMTQHIQNNTANKKSGDFEVKQKKQESGVEQQNTAPTLGLR